MEKQARKPATGLCRRPSQGQLPDPVVEQLEDKDLHGKELHVDKEFPGGHPVGDLDCTELHGKELPGGHFVADLGCTKLYGKELLGKNPVDDLV